MNDKYFDRELSWIDFNARVLGEARDESNPLLERLKFIGIVSSNLDEFFMVRVASLSATDPIFKDVYRHAFDLMDRQNHYFQESLVPQLEHAGIRRLLPQGLTDKQRDYLAALFHHEIFPLLTPVAIRPENPVPVFVNQSLYRMVALADPVRLKVRHYAVVEVPKNYPRMIALLSDSGYSFITLEDVISMFAGDLFTGYEILEQGTFRITRASELSVDEEKDEDFSKVLSAALSLRQRSRIVRLEYSGYDLMRDFLKAQLEISDFKIYEVRSWMDLKTIAQLAYQPTFPELKRPQWVPKPSPDFEKADDVWKLLKEKDVMVLHPYESFDVFLRFLAQAARDPDVLAIKQTLYRASESSRVIHLLEEAANKGKQVTVLVELKARFDEERNIEWAHRLVNAGASVLYGVAGLKTHAKACLVVRREPEGIKRYLHLSTGNYNEKTALIYSDIGLFTSKEDMTRDVNVFFNLITGLSQPTGFSAIEISPFGLRRKLEKLIMRETLRGTKEAPGLMMVKMNALVDPDMIDALYKASQKGVQIKLNVRGVCCLKPGVKGLSDNIEVVSIVDTFLEHSRVFYFHNGGDEEIYLSSADWMPRNLDRRLEIMFPVMEEKNKRFLIDLLKHYFKDNQRSWQLNAQGQYKKKDPGSEKKFRVQEFLCKKAADNAAALSVGGKELKPQKPKLESPKDLKEEVSG
ncbi:MAG: polyphosphate kinase 1 [Candidatus Omnitrophica bacterium]|nr:polyphosphate kinase 1 [Candidatus Omnitrophota bacterium]